MSIPSVKRMVLFKHGVAYVERGGPAAGSFALSFAKDEMNDVLKSLAVWVEEGDASPGAIAFEKPESPEVALEEKGLNLPADKSLSALITAMRGRLAVVHTGTLPARDVRGEIVGIDVRPWKDGWRSSVVIATGAGSLESVELDDVRGMTLEDPVAQRDLTFLLERRRAATSHERRAVNVSVTGQATDLRVAYIVPAPVWRVSYRLLRHTEGDRERTVLSAWAIVHNPLDEDAEDVSLTLTTGQPISFQIDLYHPKHVERVMVEETSRATTAPPMQIARAMAMAPMAMGSGGPQGFGAPAPAAPAPRMAKGRGEAMADAAMAAADGAAELGDRGELFEYRIAQPITLERGGSALVPLLTKSVPARRERIWREGPAGSPDLVMAFTNDSGAVLEEGPAVVYDEGVYAGEAMVPYSTRGSSVRFAFAKDLAVRCSAKSRYETVSLGLRFGRGQALEDQRQERHVTLRAESDHDAEVTVLFELPRRSELDPRTPKPTEETANSRRFEVKVPARSAVELLVVEVSPMSRHVELRALSPRELDHWRQLKLLGEQADARLKEILRLVALTTSHRERAAVLERDKQQVVASQDAITRQLGVLKDGGPEGELRLRYVRELGASQDRIHGIDAGIDVERRAEAEASAGVEQAIQQLTR